MKKNKEIEKDQQDSLVYKFSRNARSFKIGSSMLTQIVIEYQGKLLRSYFHSCFNWTTMNAIQIYEFWILAVQK